MTLIDQRYQTIQSQMNVAGDARLKVWGNAQLNVVGNVRVLNTTVHWPVAVNVPTQPKLVIGREAIINQFIEHLNIGENIALTGLGGVGKTTLAVSLANHPAVLAHFSDGVLWGSLGQQADAMHILASWAEALGSDVSEIGNEKERAQAIKNIIGEHRLLLIIDDAWSLEATDLLRCGGPYCGHLLTTRNQLIAEQFTSHTQTAKVDVLNDTMAYELLETLAPQACEVDPVAAKALVNAVGGLPLAIELLGGYLAGGKGPRKSRYFASASKVALTDVADFQRRLQLAGQHLGALDEHEVSLAETIRLSLADLPKPVVQAFYALGAFAPKPDSFDQQAAEFVTGADSETVAQLLDYNLLEMEGERLALHQVVADVARISTAAESKQRQRDYYLALVNEDRENWQGIDKIYGQIKWAWAVAAEDESLFDLIDALYIYQNRRGLWTACVTWLQRGLILAHNQEWRQHEIACLIGQCRVYVNQGRWEAAIAQYEASLKLCQELGDRQGEGTCLIGLGYVHANQGRWDTAIAQYEASLKLCQELGDRQGEGTCLNNLGMVYRNQGRWDAAIAHFEASIKIYQGLGDRQGESACHNNLGMVYLNQGRCDAAIAQFEASLKIMQELGDRQGESTCHNNLGNVYLNQMQWDTAIAQFEASLKVKQELGDRPGESACLTNLGNVYCYQRRWDAAIAKHEASLKIVQELGDRPGESACLANLGSVYGYQERWEAAITQYEASLKIMRELGDHQNESTCLINLGFVYGKLGKREEAAALWKEALTKLNPDSPVYPILQFMLRVIENPLIKMAAGLGNIFRKLKHNS